MRGSLLIGAVATLLLASCRAQPVNGAQATKAPSPTPRPVTLKLMDAAAPPGVNVPGAHWIKIIGAGGVPANEQIAAVFRPSGQGPFPLVVELHGSLGLKDVDVEFAAKLAAAGFVTIAGCWQPSTVPPDTFTFYELTIRFIACPNLSPGGSASGPLPGDLDAIGALISAGRMQPGVRADSVGIYGMSAGASRGLDFLAIRHDLRAAVLDSPGGGSDISPITTPLLILAGTADEYESFTAEKNLVESLQQAGKPVEWHYYQAGRHTLILDPTYKADAVQRIIDFFKRHLSGSD
jgi:dienelactone hydrolase